MPPPRPRTGTWISSGVPRGGPVATALMVVMVPVTLVWSGPSWATVAGGAVEVVVGPARGRELWWPRATAAQAPVASSATATASTARWSAERRATLRA